MITFFLIIAAVALFFVLFGTDNRTLMGHWNILLDQFEFSTQEFYELFAEELRSHNIPDLHIYGLELAQAGVLSTHRNYLRIRWKDYKYDCCFAPFGSGSFASWWFYYERGILESAASKIPFIGGWLVKSFFPVTYYRLDTSSMFMKYAQGSFLKVIEQITENKGLRKLTEVEKTPVLKDIFDR